MKSAKTTNACVTVDCPECGDNIEHPETGSFIWDLNAPVKEQELECLQCGAKSKTPKKLLRTNNIY